MFWLRNEEMQRPVSEEVRCFRVYSVIRLAPESDLSNRRCDEGNLIS